MSTPGGRRSCHIFEFVRKFDDFDFSYFHALADWRGQDKRLGPVAINFLALSGFVTVQWSLLSYW